MQRSESRAEHSSSIPAHIVLVKVGLSSQGRSHALTKPNGTGRSFSPLPSTITGKKPPSHSSHPPPTTALGPQCAARLPGVLTCSPRQGSAPAFLALSQPRPAGPQALRKSSGPAGLAGASVRPGPARPGPALPTEAMPYAASTRHGSSGAFPQQGRHVPFPLPCESRGNLLEAAHASAHRWQ